MEYRRRIRFVSYNSNKCKEYLRADFSYECAYCGLKESDTGALGDEYYEIDHFVPQNPENELDKIVDVHKYENLYYSCELCNSKKSNIWSKELLDPCDVI